MINRKQNFDIVLKPASKASWCEWICINPKLKTVTYLLEYHRFTTLILYPCSQNLGKSCIVALIWNDFHSFCWLGSVAGSVIQAIGRPEFEDGLRTGVLLHCVTCWTSVRTKLGVNMDTLGEPGVARLSNEVRFGPGGKPSSSKCPRQAVVGLRWWVHMV